MRAPMSWLRECADIPADAGTKEVADRLTMLGLKLEALHAVGADVIGPIVVGKVVDVVAETHTNGKTIRWCQVDTGERAPRGIVCGAANFVAGDSVVVALPGAVLPGGFQIAARKTYGHVSDGMICSARELGLGDDHTGIVVLDNADAVPGDDAAVLLQLRDEVIEFEINPDRAYALSMRGVARETSIAFATAFRDPALTHPVAVAGEGYPVRVDDASGCQVFVALEVRGFDPTASSPRWLQRRVQLAGMRPISLAVDVTNYVMLELGQPLHGYDRSLLQGSIVVRRADVGEKLTTLDGSSRELDPEDLVIADDSGPIGLAGVMGGEGTELSADTSDIVVEAANFSPVAIARAAKRHRLPSEASRRFERGVDPTICAVAARRAADLLVEYGGGIVAPVATIVGSAAPREAIVIDDRLPARISGIPVDPETARDALVQVGCDVAVAPGRLSAIPPYWRPDLTDPYDLVEEVVRLVGYDKVPSVLPAAPAGRGLTRRQRLRRRIGSTVAAAGFVESMAYPFIGGRDFDALQLAAGDPRRIALRIANPLSDERPLLRTSLLPGLLETLARNAGRGRPDVGIFEVGSVFLPGSERPKAPALGVDGPPTADEFKQLEAALPSQPLRLGVVASGARTPSGWWGAGSATLWADAIEVCRVVARALGLTVDSVQATMAPWHPGRCAELTLGAATIGYAGELHPKVCEQYRVPARTVAAEIDLDMLISQAVDIVSAPDFSTYPVAKEDVALVVDTGVAAADVEAALRAGAGELLEDLRLFDVFSGAQVGAGKKSLAYALRFRAPDRTLTEAEVRAAVESAVATASSRVGAVQRA